jgi:hypothetical protein
MYDKPRLILVLAITLCFGGSLFPSEINAQTPQPTLHAGGIFLYTNVERHRAGLPILASDPALSRAAMLKMQDLFARQYFAHESPSGETIDDLADRIGYAYLAIGENLAMGTFQTNKEVVDAWMNSPGHRENILSRTYSQIGVAAGRSIYQGRSVWMIVQAFGLPVGACPQTDNTLRESIDRAEGGLKAMEVIVRMRKAALQEEGLRVAEYNARVDAFNKAVNVYNVTASRYQAMVNEYNTSVVELNTCIKERVPTA